MIYRISIVLIAGFWAVMTFLYVRSELFPESDARWRQIPPGHVLDVIFRENESSELVFFYKDEKMGSLTLYPRQNNVDERQLTVRSDVLVRTPDKEIYRVRVDVLVRTTDEFEVQDLSFSIHVPKLEMRLAVKIEDDRYEYDLEQNEVVIASDAGTVRELLQRGVPGLDLPGVTLPRQMSLPDVRARLGTLHVQGEPVDVFHLVLRHAEELETLIHVSQVGRILGMDTPFGIRLAAEGVDL